MNLHCIIPHNRRTYQLITNFQQAYQKCSHKIGQPHQNATLWKWKHHIPLQHGCNWVNTYISLTSCALITQSTALLFPSFSLPQINKPLNLIQAQWWSGELIEVKRLLSLSQCKTTQCWHVWHGHKTEKRCTPP